MLKGWLMLALMLVLMMGSALAQDAPAELTYGTPVEGELGDQQMDEAWTLTVDSADRITVQVERLSGDLLPQLALRSAGGDVLATAGPDSTGAVARIDRADLTAAGTYQIIVQRLDGATGVTGGGYRLRVSPLGTAALNPANQSIIADVTFGEPVRGEISGAHWYHRYRFTALSADMIRVDVRRLTGGLQPQIEILNAGGEQVTYGWGNASMDGATVDRIELPAAGEYTIAVLRNGGIDGGTAGRYEMTVTLLGAGEGNPLLTERPLRPVVYGVPASGQISELWYENWLLTAFSADTITVVLTSDGITGNGPGNLVPQVALLDSEGNEVARGWPDSLGATATIWYFPLPAAGDYIVRAERSSGKVGGTSGPYTLTVSLAGVGADSPALTNLTGSLRLGAAVTGEITDFQWENRWQFDGRAGQQVDIIAERTSGTLYPLLELIAPDGSVVTGAWYDASRARSAMLAAGLGQDGTYIIRLRRENDQNGATEGGYRLSLALHTP
jgi:hypothetical protein